MLNNGADLLVYCNSGHDAHVMSWVVSEDKTKHEMDLLCPVCSRTCILFIASRSEVTINNIEKTN